jgi:hypothetical protein
MRHRIRCHLKRSAAPWKLSAGWLPRWMAPTRDYARSCIRRSASRGSTTHTPGLWRFEQISVGVWYVSEGRTQPYAYRNSPPGWCCRALPYIPGWCLGRLPGERPCLSLVWAVLDRASRGWRGVVMTPAGVRLLQDLRRRLLRPPQVEEVIDQTVTAAA